MKVWELLESAPGKKGKTQKARNFVAKHQQTSGAGAHKDKKKEMKKGNVKHKKGYADDIAESASAGATTAANVSTGPTYKNKPAKTLKNKDGTAKNALDIDANLITGGSVKR